MATIRLSSRSTAATILSIVIASLALTAHTRVASAGYDGVVADHFMGLNPRSGSRFLAAVDAKKGDDCNSDAGSSGGNVCSATPAKGGTQLLFCCKNHCRNVLDDRNNCGACGTKCPFGTLCCSGNCTAVAYDVNNCGKCGEVCKAGVRCEYGSCGYA